MESSPETPPPASSPAASGANAALGQRIGAFLIDWVVMIVIVVVLSFVSSALASIVAIAFSLTRDCLPFLDGQSPGKKVVGLRAVTQDGASLSGNWGPGILRNVILLIPFLPLVELIMLIVRQGKPEEGRRLGDDIAKTKVVTV